MTGEPALHLHGGCGHRLGIDKSTAGRLRQRAQADGLLDADDAIAMTQRSAAGNARHQFPLCLLVHPCGSPPVGKPCDEDGQTATDIRSSAACC